MLDTVFSTSEDRGYYLRSQSRIGKETAVSDALKDEKEEWKLENIRSSLILKNVSDNLERHAPVRHVRTAVDLHLLVEKACRQILCLILPVAMTIVYSLFIRFVEGFNGIRQSKPGTSSKWKYTGYTFIFTIILSAIFLGLYRFRYYRLFEVGAALIHWLFLVTTSAFVISIIAWNFAFMIDVIIASILIWNISVVSIFVLFIGGPRICELMIQGYIAGNVAILIDWYLPFEAFCLIVLLTIIWDISFAVHPTRTMRILLIPLKGFKGNVKTEHLYPEIKNEGVELRSSIISLRDSIISEKKERQVNVNNELQSLSHKDFVSLFSRKYFRREAGFVNEKGSQFRPYEDAVGKKRMLSKEIGKHNLHGKYTTDTDTNSNSRTRSLQKVVHTMEENNKPDVITDSIDTQKSNRNVVGALESMRSNVDDDDKTMGLIKQTNESLISKYRSTTNRHSSMLNLKTITNNRDSLPSMVFQPGFLANFRRIDSTRLRSGIGDIRDVLYEIQRHENDNIRLGVCDMILFSTLFLKFGVDCNIVIGFLVDWNIVVGCLATLVTGLMIVAIQLFLKMNSIFTISVQLIVCYFTYLWIDCCSNPFLSYMSKNQVFL